MRDSPRVGIIGDLRRLEFSEQGAAVDEQRAGCQAGWGTMKMTSDCLSLHVNFSSICVGTTVSQS